MTKQLTIISPYPPYRTKYESKHSALASFVKNKVDNFDKNISIKILADIIDDKKQWQEKNVEVKRVWQRKSFLSYVNLLKEISRDKQSNKILIELEWNLFGKNPFYILPFPVFCLILKLFYKKELYIVTHGVSLNFSQLAPQLGLDPNSLKSKFYNLGLNIFYWLLNKSATNIITLEQHLADKINKKLSTQKAVFIPHGVDTDLKLFNKTKSREKLGIDRNKFLLVCFGFLTWYKGSDKLAEIFSNYVKQEKDRNIQLIFSGGPSKTHQKDLNYQEFIKKINRIVNKTKEIEISGFVAEEDITHYYSAADLIVLPYRKFISSSGPLSLAFSLGKPVLLSQNMKNYLKSPDFKKALNKVSLDEDKLFFPLNKIGIKRGLNNFKNNKQKFTKFSNIMKQQRGWNIVSQNYLDLIFK